MGSSPNWLKKDIKKDLKFPVMFGISHDWWGGPLFFNNEVLAAC
jgi:hypothetical protein